MSGNVCSTRPCINVQRHSNSYMEIPKVFLKYMESVNDFALGSNESLPSEAGVGLSFVELLYL